MEIKFYSKNVELTEKIKDQFRKKLLFLKKYKGEIDVLNVLVDISRDAHHKKGNVFRVEVNVDMPGKVLRSTEESYDIISGLDVVLEKLERQARDLKDRVVSTRRKKKSE
jgi:ribosomal subunit interface protein